MFSRNTLFVGVLAACLAVATNVVDRTTRRRPRLAARERARASTSTAAAASGTPLKVLVTSFADSPLGDASEIWAGAKVAADNINKSGGVNGHPIEVVTCNGKNDPKAEVACARKGVSEGVIAATGGLAVANPPGVVDVLNRAHIADVSAVAVTPPQYSLPNTFPLETPSGAVQSCLAPQAFAKTQAKKWAVVSAENPLSDATFGSLKAVMAANPDVAAKFTTNVKVAAHDAGLRASRPAAQRQGRGVRRDQPLSASSARFVTAASSAGLKLSYCTDFSLFTPDVVAKVAKLSKVFLVPTVFPPASESGKFPMVKQFFDQLDVAAKAGNEDADVTKKSFPNLAHPWYGMQIVKQVGDSVKGEITATSFLDQMQKANVDLGYAQVDFTKPLGHKPFERVFQPNVFLTAWNTDTNKQELVAPVNILKLQAGQQQ